MQEQERQREGAPHCHHHGGQTQHGGGRRSSHNYQAVSAVTGWPPGWLTFWEGVRDDCETKRERTALYTQQNDKMNIESFEAGLSNPFAQQKVGHKRPTHRLIRF